MKYLVTGGAGFIGSTVVRQLLQQPGAEVLVVDNLSSGQAANLEGVTGPWDLANVDICNAAALAPLFAGVDVVIHLAAIPSVPRSIKDPIPSHDVNINGTFNVLQASVAAGVKRLVYAASSSAYGDTEVLPKVETMRPLPKSPYAAQKLMGEHYCSVFHSCFGLETIALRFFNVFGPRQDPSSPYSGVLSLFMTCVLDHRAPTLFGDGGQTRDFTYVEDVAGLVLKATRAPASACGKVFNAGNGNRYSLLETWDLLQKIAGVVIPPSFGPPREGDVRDSQADTARAIAELGHDPQFTFEEGLRRTLDWYRDHR